jgi:hypothetical protein
MIALCPSLSDRPPHGLWSLWNMLEIEAKPFCEAIAQIERVRTIFQNDKDNADGLFYETKIVDDGVKRIILPELEKLKTAVGDLNARLTHKAVVRLIDRINNNANDAVKITYGLTARSMETIYGRLVDELDNKKLLSIEDDRLKYYGPNQSLFGVDFPQKFLSGAFELDEAANVLRWVDQPQRCSI